MKKFLPAVVYFLMGWLPVYAQWSYIQDDPAIQAVANCLAEDADGNIVAAGGPFGYPLSGEGPTRVTKLSPSGMLIWEIEIPTIAGIGEVSASSIVVADDGYVLFCSGFEHPLVVKIGFDGSVIWTSESWSASTDLGACPDGHGVMLDDGTFLLVSLDSSIPTQVRIWRIAADGDLIEEVTHSVSLGGTQIISAWDAASHGDGVVISGGGLDASFTYMTYLCSFAADGSFEWLESYADFAGMEAYGLCATSDGGYAASAYNFFGGETALLKTDADGNLEWGQTYAATDPSAFIAYAYDVAQLSDGTYAMAHVNLDTWYLHYGDIEILQIDETGVETARLVAEGAMRNDVTELIATSDGGYAFAGKFSLDDITEPVIDPVYMVQKSSSTGVLPACLYDCVWPGDANNDGIANTDDILTLGVFYGSTGAPRTDTSIDWYAHEADAWMDNNQYADANGDGVLNDDDTLAVSLNYGYEHEIYSLRLQSDIALNIVTPEEALVPGAYQFPIELGDELYYPEEIYGIRFTVTYEGNDLDVSSLKFHFEDNWFGNAGEEIRFQKNNTTLQQLDVVLVRKDQNNTSGFGEIGSLGFVVIDNIAGRGESIVFTLSDIRAIDASFNEIAVAGGSATVESTSTTLAETQDVYQVQLYPNPVQHATVFLSTSTLPERIQLSDLAGHLVKELHTPSFAQGQFSVEGMPAGTYLVELMWQHSSRVVTLVIP